VPSLAEEGSSSEASLDAAGRRPQAWQAVAVALHKEVDPQRTDLGERREARVEVLRIVTSA
jgi:hypothetical protein